MKAQGEEREKEDLDHEDIVRDIEELEGGMRGKVLDEQGFVIKGDPEREELMQDIEDLEAGRRGAVMDDGGFVLEAQGSGDIDMNEPEVELQDQAVERSER